MIAKLRADRGYNINSKRVLPLTLFSAGGPILTPELPKHLAGAYMPTYNLYKTYGVVF
jgi:hypothetical protein